MSEYLGDANRENVLAWNVGQVVKWATAENLSCVVQFVEHEEIDGRALLMLTERDLAGEMTIGLRKNLLLAIRQLHRASDYQTLDFLGLLDGPPPMHTASNHLLEHQDLGTVPGGHFGSLPGSGSGDIDRISPASSTVGGARGAVVSSNKPEVFKTFVSIGEC